jgi:hypothetical protein
MKLFSQIAYALAQNSEWVPDKHKLYITEWYWCILKETQLFIKTYSDAER